MTDMHVFERAIKLGEPMNPNFLKDLETVYNTLTDNEKVAAVTLDDVLGVYSGINGRCCCGCSGKHYYASQHQKRAGKKRGYPVTDDEVNDRQVTRIFNLASQKKTEVSTNYISAVIGKRLYIAYFN